MILFYILVLSLPLSYHWLFDYILVAGLTVIKVVGLACLPLALFRLATRRSERFKGSGVFLPLIVYFLIALFSFFSVWTDTRNLATGTELIPKLLFYNLISMMTFFTLIVGLVDSVTRLYRVLLTMIGSAGLASIYVIRDWMSNRAIPNYRPGGAVGDANYFALCAATCLVLTLHLALSGRPRREQLFLYGCLATTSVAFLMAASRGGMIGLGVGFSFLMFRSGRGMRNLAILTLLMAPLLFVVPNTVIQRFTNPGVGDEQAVYNRRITWKAGLRMVAAHPILGVGLGSFKGVVLHYEGKDPRVASIAHNTYIEIAAELGIPGLLAYTALLIASFRAWSHFTKPKNQPDNPRLREISVGFQAALLTAAACAFFLSAWWYRFFWLVIFLPACLPAVERSLAREPRVRALQTDLAELRV